MKKIAIIQARMGSTRLPGKVMLPLNGKPAISHVMDRVMMCKDLDKVYLATSDLPNNDLLAKLAEVYGWNIFKGSEEDVVSRYVDIVKKEKPDIVVRVCADNFAIDPGVISHAINELIDKKYDVCNPFLQNTYPFGSGAEVSTRECILRIDKDTKSKDPRFREHVYFYAYSHQKEYKVGNLQAPEKLNRPEINISVDTPKDYNLVKTIYEEFKDKIFFTLTDTIAAWDRIMNKSVRSGGKA